MKKWKKLFSFFLFYSLTRKILWKDIYPFEDNNDFERKILKIIKLIEKIICEKFEEWKDLLFSDWSRKGLNL